jgi:autotransporter-associated beta strand protein
MLQGSNTVFVSTNGVPATLAFSNALTGAGSLSKIGSGTLVLAASNTYSGNTLVNTGTLALVGSATIGASAAIVLGPDTALDVSARSDSRLTLARGQLLSGAGTVLGSLTAGPGSTVSPGPAIALLSVTNDILLQGTNVMKLNKGAATNDVLLSGADLSYGGILRLTNLSGTLLPGDTFKLFSASNYTGMFTNVTPLPGSGLAWSTNLLTTNGTIAVVLASPVITNINWLRTNVIIAGTNGFPNTNYYVLSGTNLAVPLTNWTRLATNLFDLSGNFIFTNSSDPLLPEQYYLLQLP